MARTSPPVPAHGGQQPRLAAPGPAFPGQGRLPERRLPPGRGAADRWPGRRAGLHRRERGDAPPGGTLYPPDEPLLLPLLRYQMHNADKAVLRIGTGIGLATGICYGLALPMPHLGVIMAWVVLCRPGEPLSLGKGLLGGDLS